MARITPIKRAVSGKDIELRLDKYRDYGQTCYMVDLRKDGILSLRCSYDSYIDALDKYYDMITKGTVSYGNKFERVV